MDRSEIRRKIAETLSVVVDDPDLELTDETTSDDVPEWDSINHVKLIIALELELHIRFEPDEISELSNVGALVDVIAGKL